MKKYFAFVTFFVLITLVFAQNINASIWEENLVEITTEIYGLNYGKNTIKLTQKEADNVDELFNQIREQLQNTMSREQTEEIFKEAVVELDKYSLLGGLSVKQAQNLVIGSYQKNSEVKTNEYNLEKIDGNDYLDNYRCEIIGNLTSGLTAVYRPVWFNIILKVLGITDIILWLSDYWDIFRFILPFLMPIAIISAIAFNRPAIFQRICPYKFHNHIAIGEKTLFGFPVKEIKYTPGEGWMWTDGEKGIQEINGSFYGNHSWTGNKGYHVYCKGVVNFNGYIYSRGKIDRIIGNAEIVSFSKEYPFD